MSIVERYTKELRRYEGIVYGGLTLYPLTVEDYALFSSARPAFELMQASLPPALARLGWYHCLEALDEDAAQRGERGGFANSVLSVLAVALRLTPFRDAGSGKDVFPLRSVLDGQNRTRAVVIGDPANPVILNPMQMGEIRQILAAQNGYDIPDENWNPELVKALEYTRAQSNLGIVFDLEKLVQSVASASGVREREVWTWPIKEFMGAQEAIDRRLRYQIYAQAEATGFVKFKNGNPYPTWKFDRRAELPGDFTSVDELDRQSGGLLGTPRQTEAAI